MTTSITLRSTKGAALTHAEVDANFTNLQTTADEALAATVTLTANKAEATALGVANTDQNMGSFTGTTISDNVSAKAALQELETAVESASGSAATKANATAVGVSASAANMGTYTGTTIPDNETAKQNLQTLETAVEARAVSATLAATGGASLIGHDDGASGSLWSTVAGFITYLRSSVGSSIMGFIQSGTGAVARTMQAKARDIFSVTDYPVSALDIGPAVNDLISDTGGAVSALGFGGAIIPKGSWLLSETALSTSQSLEIRGIDGAIVSWNGAASGYMFRIQDSSFAKLSDLVILGKSGAVPAAAVYYDDTSGTTSTSGTNESLRLERLRIGRRWGGDAGNSTGFVRGVTIGGPNAVNNDQFVFDQVTIWDCSTAGIDVQNAQSIWGHVRDVVTDTCGTGIIAGSNMQGTNLGFNRNTVADYAPFRDTVHLIDGFNAENSVLLINQSQNASVFITGGKCLLNGTYMTGSYWATFAATKDVSLTDWLVDPGATSGKKAQFNASSTQRGRITIRGCRLPSGDTRDGYELNATASSCGLRFNIEQGSFRVRGTLDGSQTYDPASMLDGETLLVSQAMAAGAGLSLGDGVMVSFGTALAGVMLTGNCYANNLLYTRFNNESGGTVDLASGKLRWRKLDAREIKAKTSAVYDYASIADNAYENAAITVPCALGDFVYWGAGVDCRSLVMSAYVSAANTVKLNATNLSGGAVNLASATWVAYVIRDSAFDFIGSAVVDAPSIADDDGYSFTVPVPGAKVGDHALAAFGVDLVGLAHSVWISADDTATVRLHNCTGAAVDLASQAVRVGAFISLS